MPRHVVAVLALGEGDVTHGAGGTDVDLFRPVEVDLPLLSDKFFVLKENVETRVTEGQVLGQIVEFVARVGALVAGEVDLVLVDDVVNFLGVVSKLVHEVPTNVVAVGALGKDLVADGTRAADVDPLRLAHVRLPLLLDQLLNCRSIVSMTASTFALTIVVRSL